MGDRFSQQKEELIDTQDGMQECQYDIITERRNFILQAEPMNCLCLISSFK